MIEYIYDAAIGAIVVFSVLTYAYPWYKATEE